MKIKIIGQKPHPIHKVSTGWYSFDQAFINADGQTGFPVRGMVELYGPTGVGKSTMALGLSGKIASIDNRNIEFADIEGFDPNYVISILEMAGFEGGLHFVSGKTDEEALDEVIDNISKHDIEMGIFDSVGVVSPISEIEGDLGEANMGRRAKLLAQFSRKLTHLMKAKPDTSVIMINHQHPRIGGRGWYTPGGETIGYLSPVRIHVKKSSDTFSNGYCIEGTVKKHRYGVELLTFNLFVLSGYGIHDGLTALMDCRTNKLANKDRVIKMGDESFGYMKDILKKAEQGDNDFFIPFQEALKGLDNDRTEEPKKTNRRITMTTELESDERLIFLNGHLI